MKRFFALALMLILLVTALPALAYNYDDTSYPLYRIWTVVADNVLYMYPVAGSSGQPSNYYKKGILLRVINWYVSENSNYCYAVGPDGKEGYVRKSCLLRQYDYNDSSLASYIVNSTYYENGQYRLYMYPTPTSGTDPVDVTGYFNGTVLKVVDWNVDTKYCYAVGPNNLCGFVRKEYLTYSSGSVPTSSLPATEYYWPGMAKNSGSSSSKTTPTPTPTPAPFPYDDTLFPGTAMNGMFSARASSYTVSYGEYCDPGKAIDNDAFTSWDANGEYEGAWIEFVSNVGQVTVSGLRIQNGNRRRATSSSLYFYRYSRVKTFSLYVDGRFVTSGTLSDTSDWQNVVFNQAITGTTFRIYIDGVYQGTGTPYSQYGVSIANILFM